MAGVATAAPLSAAGALSGALYWIPATISGLDRSQLEVGAELLLVQTQVASHIDAGAPGPGVPPVTLFGRAGTDTGVAPLLTLALAYLPDGSPRSFGLGIFAVAGFGVDYAGSTANPLLTAHPPTGVGFGPVFSDYEVLQIEPTETYKLTDRLSVSAGPILDLGKLRVDLFILAPPKNASGNSFSTYPPGAH
jgi:long-chain fatty acid transport protein